MTKGFSAFGDGNTEDCFGHGTHVSGIVGGLTYGVAKNVTIVPGEPATLWYLLTYPVKSVHAPC